MDRREFLISSAGAAGALALGACRPNLPGSTSSGVGSLSEPSLRPTLRMSGGNFGFPSPFGYLPPGYNRMTYIYDSLVWTDPQGKLVPWLASKWEASPDGASYIFDLREGVRWHDGKPLTAEDVAFSFEYIFAKQQTLPALTTFKPEWIRKVTPGGDQKVIVELERPVVIFPETISGFPIYPKHVWSSVDDPIQVRNPKMLIGSGPYRLRSFSATKGTYLYTANDDFWLGKPFVKRLELRPAADEFLSLADGEIDVGGFSSGGAPNTALRRFQQDPRFGVYTGDPEFPAVLMWNLGKSPVLRDVRFRRACAMAIDRGDMARRILGGNGEPGNPGFLPPGHPFRVEVEQYRFNPGRANRLLDEAGYKRSSRDGARVGPDGRPLKFTLLAIPPLANAVEIVRQSFKKIGVELEVDPIEFFSAFGRLSGGDYEMALIFYAGVGQDPDYMRRLYSSRVEEKPFHHAQGWGDAEFDELADRQLVEHDLAERKRLVGRMQQIAARDIPFLHLYYPRLSIVYRKSVFDQIEPGFNKQVFVTGLREGGFKIRPIKEG